MRYSLIFSIIFLYSTYAFSAESSLSKEAIISITEIINQLPSTGSSPIVLCGDKKTDIDFLECSEAIELQKSMRTNSKGSDASQRLQIDKLVTACFKKRFEKCYPNLKEEISKDEINKLFNEWKKDPRFRYPSGVGMCHFRAQTLSYHLAKLGFKTTTIRIEHSPTLIAMDRNENDQLNGNYDDYQGYHTIVQILVNQNGKSVPYILDPQYMTEAMPRDLYFIKTTGQVCAKSDITLDMTSCTYKEQAQNTIADGHGLFNPNSIDDTALKCGWAGSKVENQISLWPKPILKNDNKIVNTNGVTMPDRFKGESVSEKTSKELIISAYENYEKELNRQLLEINSSLAMEDEIVNGIEDSQSLSMFMKDFKEVSEKNKRMKKNIEYSLGKIKEKIEIVKKNLE